MYANASAFASVELLQLHSGEGGEEAAAGGWSAGPPMSEERCAFGCALHHESGQLVAAGGYGGAERYRYLDTAEVLDTSGDGRWRGLPPLSCKRAGCAAAAGPDGRTFVVGGGPDGRGQHRSMEALDLRTGAWDTTLAPPRVGRHYNATAFGPDGRLYCSGTFRHDGQLDVVERYDPRADRWEDLPDIGAVVGFSSGVFLF